MIELTSDQLDITRGMVDCFQRNSLEVVKLTGYAGTGKTTIIKEFSNYYKTQRTRKIKVAYVTFTGKASSVLKSKISDIFDDKFDFCGTIHSMMYRPVVEKDRITGKSKVVRWDKRVDLDYDMIIVDEASMLPQDIYKDLRSYNIPMLLVGDHGQLPPVSENQKSVLENPHFTLTEIHRQCKDNPIIQLSEYVRKQGVLPSLQIWSKEVFKFPWKHDKCQELFNNVKLDGDVMMLCGFNKTRVKINQIIRDRLGFTMDDPYPGEKVICLRNNKTAGIMNGQTGTLLLSIPLSKVISEMSISMDGLEEVYQGKVDIRAFGKESYQPDDNKYDPNNRGRRQTTKKKEEPKDLFEFGYCISVHKSQGSEWDNIIMFDQRTSQWDDAYYAKWLYTGITRARNKLFIIGDCWI